MHSQHLPDTSDRSWAASTTKTLKASHGWTGFRVVPMFCIFLLTCGFAMAQVSPVAESKAKALLAKHAELRPYLTQNAYSRPLYLDSTENRSDVNGNAYAVLDAPFETVNVAFKSPGRWCEVMILHINTKYCKATSDKAPTLLKVHIGKKTPQDLADAYSLEFGMKLALAAPDYLSVQLNSDKGPLGTTDYRIELEAAPLAGDKTFIHLRYSYAYGMASRLAMQGYLATLGSGKVGFTKLNTTQKPAYVAGLRGAVERNTMRYYLAIEAFLASHNKAPDTRFEYWFDATEQYPLQLHETDRNSYLTMKRSELQRQQGGTPG
jgi:hypothetical protein